MRTGAVSNDMRRASDLELDVGKYRDTHVINASIVPDGKILWMPFDSKLQLALVLILDERSWMRRCILEDTGFP